jgi:hypothetical protein
MMSVNISYVIFSYVNSHLIKLLNKTAYEGVSELKKGGGGGGRFFSIMLPDCFR